MSLLIHVYLQLGDNTETRAVCALSFLLIFLIFQSFWWSGGRPGKTGDIIEPHIRPTNKMMHQSQKREWLELRPGIIKVKKYKEKKSSFLSDAVAAIKAAVEHQSYML